MRKLTAERIYPVSAPPIDNGVVIVDDDGTIQALGKSADYSNAELERHSGVLVPGFVNAHCHLELSHMKGKVATGTGLLPFITSVVSQREAAAEAITQAIEDAETEMLNNGIVAVGDISNVPDTFIQKSRERLRYYTFVEMFDFLQEAHADNVFDSYMDVYGKLSLGDGHAKSCVPHSPYTVSQSLFRKIAAFNRDVRCTVSIHNQEMQPENDLFINKSGGLVDFYAAFDVSLEDFEPVGQTSIHYALANLDPAHRTLFVHNTLTTDREIALAEEWGSEVYWATCPNANLFIENRLPDYSGFIKLGARMTIGTDSLTSNWQLSILDEMKTIARYQSYVDFDMMLQWATLNGARALGFDDTLGSFDTGKRPGINLITMRPGGSLLDENVIVRRLI